MGRDRRDGMAFGHHKTRNATKDSDQFVVVVVVVPPQSEIDLFASISPLRITLSSKFSRQRKRRERAGNLFSGGVRPSVRVRPFASSHTVSILAGWPLYWFSL